MTCAGCKCFRRTREKGRYELGRCALIAKEPDGYGISWTVGERLRHPDQGVVVPEDFGCIFHVAAEVVAR